MILLLLASYGLAFFLQQKADWLTEPVRSRIALIDKLLSCTFCTGFWCGLLVFLLGSWADGSVLSLGFPEYIHGLLVFGFASAAFSYGLDAAIQWFEESRSAG
jgi:hypothetical protein